MKRKIIQGLLFLATILCFATSCQVHQSTSTENTIQPDESKDSIDNSLLTEAVDLGEPYLSNNDSLQNMIKTIEFLCKEPRPIGSVHEKESALYIELSLKSMGYQVDMLPFEYQLPEKQQSFLGQQYFQKNVEEIRTFYFQPFEGKADGSSYNIVTKKESAKPNTPILVISAHYDSSSNSIGVIDNASGVAVLVELANKLKNVDLPYEVWFVFFSGEDEMLLGSRAFLRDLSISEKDRIRGNLHIDCFAHKSDLKYSVCASGYNATQLEDGQNIFADALRKQENVTVDFGNSTDARSFYIAGIESALFIGAKPDDPLESEMFQHINSAEDTFECLDFQRLTESLDLLYITILSIGSR